MRVKAFMSLANKTPKSRHKNYLYVLENSQKYPTVRRNGPTEYSHYNCTLLRVPFFFFFLAFSMTLTRFKAN